MVPPGGKRAAWEFQSYTLQAFLGACFVCVLVTFCGIEILLRVAGKLPKRAKRAVNVLRDVANSVDDSISEQSE